MSLDIKSLAGLSKDLSGVVLPQDLVERVNTATLSVEELKFLLRVVQQLKPRSILELGGGLSTRFFAYALGTLGIKAPRIVSCDHSQKWLGVTKAAIEAEGAAGIEFLHCPIQPFQHGGRLYATYSPLALRKTIEPSETFDLILIDGPPGYRFGRESTLYLVAPYLRPDTLVLLDDALREPEQQALRSWSEALGADLEMATLSLPPHGLTLLQVKNPAKLRSSRFEPGEFFKSVPSLGRQMFLAYGSRIKEQMGRV